MLSVPSPRRAPSGPRTAALTALTALSLGTGLLVAAPAARAEPGVAPPAPPVVADTVPVEVSVPGYANATTRTARATPGSGTADTTVPIGNGGGQALWGDWDGNGTWTPGTFVAGQWTLWSTAVNPAESAPRANRTFGYGSPGDTAVVGDWNNDGRTDIGIFSKGVWVLRMKPTPGPGQRVFRFGQAGDVPVTGDWDGDGKTTFGLRRGATFYLTDAQKGSLPPKPKPKPVPKPKPGQPKPAPVPPPPPVAAPTGPLKIYGTSVRSIVLGRFTDRPVTGDWDGDGKDAVGIVRANTWNLRDDDLKASAQLNVVVPRPANGVPLPWRANVGRNGGGCPTAETAAMTRGNAAARYVVAPSGLDRARPTDPTALVVRETVLNSAKFQLGARWREFYGGRTAETYLDLLGDYRVQEYAIRGPANSAVSLAVSLRTGGYDATWTGVPVTAARQQASWLIRSVACQHATVTPGGWGFGWQTAHWATMAGEAAWLLWDQKGAVPTQVKAYVATMVESEADALASIPPSFWKDRNGVTAPGREGNTAAEEVAWNGAHLAFAASMMPKHPRAALWRAQAVRYAAAAFSTPADIATSVTRNGLNLGTLPGYNINDDGTVVNHGCVDPDYMAATQHMWWSAQYERLANRTYYPLAYVHHGDTVYGALTTRVFDPTVVNEYGFQWNQPGGTIYNDRPDIYFPAVKDWGTTRRASWLSLDANASLLGLGHLGTTTAEVNLAKHAQQALDLQRRFTDGRSYAPFTVGVPREDTYTGAEEYAAQQLTTGWLALYLQKNLPMAPTDEPLVPSPSFATKLGGAVTPDTSVPPLPSVKRASP